MSFSRGKTRFFVLQSKERKGTKTNPKKQKIKTFGRFRAKKTKQIKNEKEAKKNKGQTNKEIAKIPKKNFSIISQFFPFLVGGQNFPF